jgi:putative Mg2+ transporter-C (MgtC) family protein
VIELHAHFVWRIFIAFLLGSLVGFERQWHHRGAGLRTNALVSLGAAMFASIGFMILPPTADSLLRVPAQIVSGIGFLGAGLILREGFTVRGLNTAATLWCSAGIGTLCGMGLWQEAGVGAMMVLVANAVLRPVVKRVDRIRETGEDREA